MRLELACMCDWDFAALPRSMSMFNAVLCAMRGSSMHTAHLVLPNWVEDHDASGKGKSKVGQYDVHVSLSVV